MRFSGFDDEWIEEKLGNLVQIKSGECTKNLITGIDNSIPYFKVEQLNNSLKYQIKTPYFINDKSKIVNKGSIIFPKRGAAILLNKIRILNQDSFMDTNLMTLTPNNKLYNEFLYYFIYKENLSKIADTTSIPQLNNKHIKPYPIKLPSFEEQLKISKFISSVDKKVSLLSQNLEIFNDFKKGLLQQIFTQKLRFKSADGEQYSDWKERNLYEFLTEHKLKSTGNEEVYSVSVHKGLVNQKEHLGRDFSAPDTSKYNLVKPGDIVYTKSPTGDFPLGIIKQSRVDKNVIVSPLYGVFTPETYALGYILNDYFESNVNTHNYLHPIVQKGAKNTMNITNKTFLSKTLFVPTDVNEQQKIAECFSKVNDSIRNIEIQQNKVNEFKKGLLQQMFVSMRTMVS